MVARNVNYNATSPYADTDMYRLGLDVMTHRHIPRYAEDRLYEIDAQYNMRPDLLAHHLYGTSKLWWVFAARNPSALKDPLYDFVTGNRIYLPSSNTLRTALDI
jgi:hypothetical protein